MCEVGPGTPVICVHCPLDDTGYRPLTEGALYICEEVHDDSSYTCRGCKDVHRIHIVGKRYCFCLCMFRPLNDGDTSLVEDEITEEDGVLEDA